MAIATIGASDDLFSFDDLCIDRLDCRVPSCQDLLDLRKNCVTPRECCVATARDVGNQMQVDLILFLLLFILLYDLLPFYILFYGFFCFNLNLSTCIKLW